VRIEQVTFGYAPGRPILHAIDLTVQPGEHVAIVGRTGAGKTSLIALIAGLYTPWAGTIDLAGHRPHALPETERRALLGYVPQHVTLFSGTVRDNLTLGDHTIGDQQIHHAATVTGADRFIRTLPQGYDTVLSDSGRGRGVQLSAGQRQLLALTRALATRPALLLLDEATAVIDGASDAAFRTALHQHVLPAGTAVITIAHRLATARDAHRVLLMDQGRITEQGTPTHLLAAGGAFADLSALEDAGWDWHNE
jgi:ATP-binding cassette subfamily B protein